MQDLKAGKAIIMRLSIHSPVRQHRRLYKKYGYVIPYKNDSADTSVCHLFKHIPAWLVTLQEVLILSAPTLEPIKWQPLVQALRFNLHDPLCPYERKMLDLDLQIVTAY